MKPRSPRSLVWFYILVTYVVVQFAWWAFHLISLSNQVYADEKAQQRLWMILGEGGVFFVLLAIGVWQLKKSIRKEFEVNQNQKNFVLSTTHELKTPLAVVRLYLETLQKRDLSAEQQAELLEKALAENDRLTDMIDNLLMASRIESGMGSVSVKEGNLSAWLNQELDALQSRYSDRVISREVAQDVHIKYDEQAMMSVVSNLVENAFKYSHGEVGVMLEKTDQGAVMRVQDSGQGINNKSAVRELFYREQNEETRTAKGSGLGLFIVDQMCKLQGAELKLEDNPGGGTIASINMKR